MSRVLLSPGPSPAQEAVAGSAASRLISNSIECIIQDMYFVHRPAVCWCAVLAIAGGWAAGLLPAAEQAGRPRAGVALFNGKNLDGWEVVAGDAADWKVVDGILTCTGRRQGWIGTKRPYANYRLVVEFRMAANADSGVFLRAPDEGNPAFAGLEVQLLDDRGAAFEGVPNDARCGGVYNLVGPDERASKAAGEWQTLEIFCTLDRIKTVLNGEVCVDVSLREFADSREAHPGIDRTSGRIGLQCWSGQVEFRSIRIVDLGQPG